MDERKSYGSPSGWVISRSGAISPPSGNHLDAAYAVRLERGASTRNLIVQFAEASPVVSNGYAEEIARQFLRDDEPPQHLEVDSSGGVTVLVGPKEATEPAIDSDPPGTRVEPRRARNHRRGASAL